MTQKALSTGKQLPGLDEQLDRVTKEQVMVTLPLSMRKNVDDDLIDLINSSCDDSDIRGEYLGNMLRWTDVLGKGAWTIKDYINAVRFVTFKLMGNNNTVAYAKAFPRRYQRLITKKVGSSRVAAVAQAYTTRKIVREMIRRTIAPVWVLHSDVLHESILVQAELMRSAKSETVRQKASATLIEHLKRPEALEVEVSVGATNDTVEDLRKVTVGLARKQQEMIKQGLIQTSDVAEGKLEVREAQEEKIIDAEYKILDGAEDVAQELFDLAGKEHVDLKEKVWRERKAEEVQGGRL